MKRLTADPRSLRAVRCRYMRMMIAVAALAACACGPATQARGIPEYGYDVVHTYPHDPQAYTQGLFYLNGFLYEGTGQWGQSSVRKVRLETGEAVGDGLEG